ncbi:SPOR domain-containing protein [Candidatus Enterovibrio altilux]|uniref:SPOR domain-containing protein n=1 Tax=Candidatus Enterovibrio altilux TaxID=1927128 RepID=UPI001237EFA1|nr:SPOR domain-containing protein [Candidatus Enterovibrio luxaltus]
MTTQFQHRLVGTLVLVLFSVILLPDVFDGKKTHYQKNYEAIPLRNEFNTELLVEFVKMPEDVEPFLSLETVNLPVNDAKKTSPAVVRILAEKSKSTEDYQNSAWIIRLGTFRNMNNAKNLVSKLRNKGYPAQLVPLDVKQGELIRVEVRPNVSKEKLAAMTVDLETLTGLKGQLLRFSQLNL